LGHLVLLACMFVAPAVIFYLWALQISRRIHSDRNGELSWTALVAVTFNEAIFWWALSTVDNPRLRYALILSIFATLLAIWQLLRRKNSLARWILAVIAISGCIGWWVLLRVPLEM
jgi:hypothetical protein